ncbi:hypothetical protein [Paroceanicella profunda]|uniref:hypothetical protein n=1 Tax=Paroceanicella profunda TaxID=2579971 RepID=UPI001EF0263F|nr:hypothetical protein [Paroceanicella profunda]
MLRALTCAVLLCPLAVTAQDRAPARHVPDCYCTDSSGARVELGDTRCLRVDGRSFLARCAMSLNVPAWREVSGGCTAAPTSGLTRPPRTG